jgi:hypothetical protein
MERHAEYFHKLKSWPSGSEHPNVDIVRQLYQALEREIFIENIQAHDAFGV